MTKRRTYGDTAKVTKAELEGALVMAQQKRDEYAADRKHLMNAVRDLIASYVYHCPEADTKSNAVAHARKLIDVLNKREAQ